LVTTVNQTRFRTLTLELVECFAWNKNPLPTPDVAEADVMAAHVCTAGDPAVNRAYGHLEM